MKFFNAGKITLLVITILLFAFFIFMRIMRLYFIHSVFGFLLPLLCFSLLVAWIYLIIRHKLNYRWLKITVIAIPMIFLTLIFPVINLAMTISDDMYYESHSPSGKNQVVVLEGGFIDAIYSAYPKVAGFMYQSQDNGHVSKHDCWGGAKIEVEWESDDIAIVKVITEGHQPNSGSNKDDIIIVSFLD